MRLEQIQVNIIQVKVCITQFMSIPAFSDEQTIDKYDSPTLQTLLNENKMKDLALKKATNLIQLLNIELQVEKNSHQESMRLIEEELNKYENDLIRLKERNQFLQREVRKMPTKNVTADARNRHSIISRINSSESLTNSSKMRSLNKKYTQTQPNELHNRQYKNAQFFGAILFKQQIIEIEEWKNSVLSELNTIVQEQYNELGSLINMIESSSEQYEDILRQKRKQKNKWQLQGQKQNMIKSQQAIINSLKIYAQEIEDLYKSIIYKLTSTPQNQIIPQGTSQFYFEDIIYKIKVKLDLKKQQWISQLAALQNQNFQLKNILDNMIKLVKQQKKIRT